MCRNRVISRYILPLMLAGVLAGCGGSRSSQTVVSGPPGLYQSGLTCAPFARELSGIALYGEAFSWWDAASGQYRRGDRPEVGGVLVFRRSSRLPLGHVAVVSRVINPRQIEVIQANWVHEQLDQDQLVVDVSARNDWSEVRVWYPPTGQIGTHTYAAYGFVLPPRPATYAELSQATRPALIFARDTRGRPPPRARGG